MIQIRPEGPDSLIKGCPGVLDGPGFLRELLKALEPYSVIVGRSSENVGYVRANWPA
jgi:hypothetical protein